MFDDLSDSNSINIWSLWDRQEARQQHAITRDGVIVLGFLRGRSVKSSTCSAAVYALNRRVQSEGSRPEKK